MNIIIIILFIIIKCFYLSLLPRRASGARAPRAARAHAADCGAPRGRAACAPAARAALLCSAGSGTTTHYVGI